MTKKSRSKGASARRTITQKVADAQTSIVDTSSSLNKMLSILDFFTPSTPILSTNDLIQAMAASRSTAYRYIKALNTAGLIAAVGNGSYVLGPRIVELDLQIRNCDPLNQAGKGILEQLVQATGFSALLCMLFSNSVLCIREHLAPLSPENMFSRGQRRPLFRGAMSKVILAHLPSHRLRVIYSRNQETIAGAGLGASWEEFRNTLTAIRKAGYAMSHGEFRPGVMGIAAPVFNGDGLILGSVGIAWHETELKDVDMARTQLATKRAGREITQRVAMMMSTMALPPRAVG